LGAIVKYRHMDGADATIVGSPRRAVIAINSSTIPTRQRFSLGHELGHWHHHRGQILSLPRADKPDF
jgi:Zn-dependent peptidase ImmA (M78 family)